MALALPVYSNYIAIDSDLANELQAESRKFVEKLYKEKAKVIEKAIVALLWKTECPIKDLRELHYADGRHYITSPSGVGFRIDMNWGNQDNNYRVTLIAVPIIMDKELPNENTK